MQQLELDFGTPTVAPVMIEVEEKRYRLERVLWFRKQPSCSQCAFDTRDCANIPDTEACLAHSGMVWKEV